LSTDPSSTTIGIPNLAALDTIDRIVLPSLKAGMTTPTLYRST
jgi:hypothetical protein